MTSIARIRSVFTGFPGGPGVATMYSVNTATLAASVRAFWQAIAGALPGDVHIQVEGFGDLLEDTTGALTGAWSTATPAIVNGTSGAPYMAPAGAVINWVSATILDGRRVRGRTFVVPIAGEAEQVDGSLSAGVLGTLSGAASGLVIAEAGGFCIWHRPRAAKPADGSRPAVTARAGGHALVTSHSVPDLVAVLRSRRD